MNFETGNKENKSKVNFTQGHNNIPFLAPSVIQKKLRIGSESDMYEVEADRVADQVVSMSDAQVQTKLQGGQSIQRSCSTCGQQEDIQKKSLTSNITPLVQRKSNASTSHQNEASGHLTQQIQHTRGSGHRMGGSTLDFMESRFGTDFSGVNIHTGSKAIQMSSDLHAQAFTVGNDIYFNNGKYNPSSASGKHLLAHELTHTLQQGKGKNIRRSIVSPFSGTISGVEEEIQKKSNTPDIQLMKERNQSGGSDHIAGGVTPWRNTVEPSGDDHRAYTDSGSTVKGWTAIDYSSQRKRYWCHGHTLDTYRQWFYSVYSGSSMRRAVSDEYNSVAEANVQSEDIAVWTPSHGHSCKIESVARNSQGAIDDSATRVSTKNGDDSLQTTSLQSTKGVYAGSLGTSVTFYRRK